MQDWYAEHDQRAKEAESIAERVEAHLVREPDYGALTDAVLTAATYLSRNLTGEPARVSVVLQDALVERLSLENRTHYSLGYEDGQTSSGVEGLVAKEPTEALRIIARALLRLAETIQEARREG